MKPKSSLVVLCQLAGSVSFYPSFGSLISLETHTGACTCRHVLWPHSLLQMTCKHMLWAPLPLSEQAALVRSLYHVRITSYLHDNFDKDYILFYFETPQSRYHYQLMPVCTMMGKSRIDTIAGFAGWNGDVTKRVSPLRHCYSSQQARG